MHQSINKTETISTTHTHTHICGFHKVRDITPAHCPGALWEQVGPCYYSQASLMH